MANFNSKSDWLQEEVYNRSDTINSFADQFKKKVRGSSDIDNSNVAVSTEPSSLFKAGEKTVIFKSA
jgi:hypothetical protein